MTQCIDANGQPAQCSAAYGIPELTALARGAGLTGDAILKAVATALAESGGIPNAVNYNTNGSKDVGLWQINDVHTTDLASRLSPSSNAKWAASISSGGTDWTPWCTWAPCVCGTCTGSANQQYSSLTGSSTSPGGSTSPPSGSTKKGGGGCNWWDYLNPLSGCLPIPGTSGGIVGQLGNPFDAAGQIGNAIDCWSHPKQCAEGTVSQAISATFKAVGVWLIIGAVGIFALWQLGHELGSRETIAVEQPAPTPLRGAARAA